MSVNQPNFAPRSASEVLNSRSVGGFAPLLWLQRFRSRCAASDCAQRGKLWPSFRTKSRGVKFDGRWYCNTECLHENLISQVRGLLAGSVQVRPRRHRVPLGLLLVNRGAISQQQLREALKLQAQSGGEKMGRVLSHMGVMAAEELTAALAYQWGCPVYPLDPRTPLLGCQDLLPLALLESARAVPVYISSDGGTLHLAFGERLDHTTLYAVERMLGCRTIACVADEASISRRLEELQRASTVGETSFDTMREPREIAWTIRSYAGEYRASQIAVARASSYLWVRFANRRFNRDLLFRIQAEPNAGTTAAFVAPKVFPDPADSRKDGISKAAGQP